MKPVVGWRYMVISCVMWSLFLHWWLQWIDISYAERLALDFAFGNVIGGQVRLRGW